MSKIFKTGGAWDTHLTALLKIENFVRNDEFSKLAEGEV